MSCSGEERNLGEGEDIRREIPRELVRRFSLTRRLGGGGQGVVYLGTHPGSGRACALKVLRHGLPAMALRRFEREARALARVHHPNLVDIFDVGSTEGFSWLAMEAVEGADLRSLRCERGRLPPEEVEGMARDLAGVLDALHGEGLIHRDIKPANVMVSGGRVLLMDLGLVHAADQTPLTRTGLVVGTPMYFPPELFETPGDTTPACDWYCLGLTLRAALLGSDPYTQEEARRMLLWVTWKPPHPLPAAVARSPLGVLVERLCAQDPAERPSSLAEVEEILDGHPPSAGAAPPVPAERRPPGRNPMPVFAGIFGLAVLAGAFGAWSSGPREPAPPDRPGDASPAPPEAPPRRAESSAALLASIVEGLGHPGEPAPRAALEILIREADDGEAGRVVRALSEKLPEEGFTTFARTLVDARDGRVREEPSLPEAPEDLDHWTGHAVLEVLQRAYVLANRTDGDPELRVRRFASAREGARRLDVLLASGTSPGHLLLRVELWGLLGRRADGLTGENLRAWERAADLLPSVLSRREELPLAARLHLAHAAVRVAVRLGDPERYLAVREELSPWALAALRGDELRRRWTLRLHKDGERLIGATGILGMEDMVERSLDPRWLPLDPWDLGAGVEGAREVGWFLPPPPTAPRVEVVRRAGRPLLEDLRRAARRARVEAADLGASREVVAELASLLPDSRELTGELLPWRGLLVAVHDAEEGPDRRTLRRALRRSWRSTRLGPSAYLRRWFGLPHAEVARRLLEPAPGERERHLDHATEILKRLVTLPPPWSTDELALGSLASRTLALSGCADAASALSRLGDARRSHLQAPGLPAWQRREADALGLEPAAADPALCPEDLGDLGRLFRRDEGPEPGSAEAPGGGSPAGQ